MSRYRNTRMFDKVTKTWNVITGCTHGCVYCWARRLATSKLCKVMPWCYDPEFKPRLVEKRLRDVKFEPGELVFVCDVGDMFCDGVPDEWILRVLEVIRKFPETEFLLLTKNPARYLKLLRQYGHDVFPPNVIFGSTIETDLDDLYLRHEVSRAPPPSMRFAALRELIETLREVKLWISVEPVIKFSNPEQFASRILDLASRARHTIVYIGYDNYDVLRQLGIPEPRQEEVLRLANILASGRVEVRLKTIRKAWCE